MNRTTAATTVCAAAALIGAGVTTNADAATMPRCQAAQLRASLHGAGVAMGTEYILVRLTNRSGAACTVAGYPEFKVDRHIKVTDGPVAGRNPAPSTIALPPGKAATALMTFADADPSRWTPWLDVRVKGDTGWDRVPFAAQMNGGITVTAWSAR